MVLVENMTADQDEELLSILEDAVFYKKLATGRYLKVNSLTDLGKLNEVFDKPKEKSPIREQITPRIPVKPAVKTAPLLDRLKDLL